MSEPEAFDPVRQIHLLGRELYSATCVGNPAPAIQALSERMRSPRVGDLVVEVSSFRGYDPDGVGWLRSLEPNPACPKIIDRYVVEPLGRPGTEQGWRNADFIALPTDRAHRWVEPQP